MSQRQVVAITIQRGDRFLLGRRSMEKKIAPGYWCPISGKIEAGESEQQAVIREAKEEIGVTVRPIKKIAEMDIENRGAHLQWWLAEIVSGEPSICNDEHTEIAWLTIEEIANLEPTFKEDLEVYRKCIANAKINITNQKAYETVARQYAGDEPGEDDPVMRATCRKIFIDALKGSDVLEIGCGPGVDADFLHKAALKVTATDFSEEFVKIVKERFPKIIAHRMDMSSPDLPHNSFDGIYSFASFIHLPRSEAQKTLNAFHSLLRNSGVIFMSLIKSTKASEYVIEDWGGHPNNPLLFTCYEPSEIEHLLKNAGFRTVEFYEVESLLYKNMPRLVERGVSHYQLLACK